MIFSPIGFLLAYALTNIIEFIPFYFLIKPPLRKKISALLLINAISLTIVWLVLPFFFAQYLIAFILIEIFVILFETGLIKIFLRQPIQNSFKTALVMNVLSAAFTFL